jgi:hypothetical protein
MTGTDTQPDAETQQQHALDRLDRQISLARLADDLPALQVRRRIVARHSPHPDHPYWCVRCSHSPNSWGWAEDWPCPDWTDAACETTP